MANRRFIDFPIASSVGDNDIVLIWQDGMNKQTTKGTLIQGAPTSLQGLTDVDIAGLINGQILQYNSTSGKWENVDRTDIDLSELGDVSIISPSNGQVLVYNSSTSKWENSSGGYVPYTGAVTTVDLGAQGLLAGYIGLNTSVVSVPNDQGLIYWDDARSTAALIMNGTLQHIGQDTFFYVKNSTGSSIPKGTAVRFNGTDGASGHLLIAPFLANGTYPSNYFMGVTAEAIANGSFGQVMHFGELTGVNTSSYTAGALLYASTSVAGAFQTTAPVAPNNIVLVAAAINSTNNGTILVRPTYGSNINQDEGVKITSGTTGDLLQLQAGGLWENKTLAQVIGSAYVPSTRTITINGTTQDLSANRTYNVGTVTSVGLSSATSGVTIGSTPVTTSGTITLAIATASGSQNGLLSSTDWTTFNNKQNALTNPVTGTGTSGQVAYFNGTTTITSESNLFWDATNDRFGIGVNLPLASLQVGNGTQTALNLADNKIHIATNSTRSALVTLANSSGGTTVEGIFESSAESADLRILIGSTSNHAVVFRANNSEAARIFTNGNFGIGTGNNNAGFKLDVNGTGRFSGALTGTSASFSGALTGTSASFSSTVAITLTASDSRIVGGNSTGRLLLANSGTSTFGIFYGASHATSPNAIQFINDNTVSLNLSSTGAATFSGDVTISKTSPTFRLTRGTTSASSLVVYNTNGTDDWLVGTGVTGTNSNYRIYNNGLGSDAIYIVKSNNNVLIGTATDAGQKMQVYSSGTTRIRVDGGGNNSGVLLAESGTSQWSLASVGGTLLFYNEVTGVTRFSLTSTGAATFNSLGTGTVTATAGLLSTVSDLFYKIDDGFIDSAIEKVLSLKPRYFYWNEKSGLPKNIRQLGFYAQEVNEALGEEAANRPKDKNTPWGISDRSIIAMLTKAIQEQQEIINDLKQKIK